MYPRNTWSTNIVVLAGFVLAVCAALYALLFDRATTRNIALIGGDECSVPEPTTKATENPNKALFISCGGFLD